MEVSVIKVEGLMVIEAAGRQTLLLAVNEVDDPEGSVMDNPISR